MKQEIMLVVEQKEIAKNIFELTLKGELVKQMATSGQFIHIRVPRSDLLLRRPISLASVSMEELTCKVIYRADGDGTKAISELTSGDKLDVMGPLGNGFDTNFIQNEDLVFIVGGGIGVPPLYELGKQLKEKEANIVFMHGFANKDAVFYEEEFSKLGEVMIITDDGSYCRKGHTGHLIEASLEKYGQPKAVYSCGPTGLLRAVETKFADHPHVYLSMEERMACGQGACVGCSISTDDGMKKVCYDGPVFYSKIFRNVYDNRGDNNG